MTTKAEQYRRNAEEADKKAEQVRDLAAKKTYQDVAERWREMAAQAEKFNR